MKTTRRKPAASKKKATTPKPARNARTRAKPKPRKPAGKTVAASRRSAKDAGKRAVEVVRKVEAAWEANDLDALDRYFVPGFRSQAEVPLLPPGLEGAKLAHQGSMAGMPDRKTEILDIFSDGRKVVVRMRMTGTNTGGIPWFGAPPNGARVDIQWISVYEVKGGKITGHYAVNDVLTMVMQLGLWRMPEM